jgi:formimidoylglutamate deiminase
VDLGDPSLAGATAQTLAATIVFGASRTAVRDVVVGGKFVVRDRFHELSETILKEFRALAPLRE